MKIHNILFSWPNPFNFFFSNFTSLCFAHFHKQFKIYINFSEHFTCSCAENSPGKILSWSERLKILIGVAKAVHFLHTGVIPGFFSNRLKSNNILLNQHRMAKLSDYGLSIISEGTENFVVEVLIQLINWFYLSNFRLILSGLDFYS